MKVCCILKRANGGMCRVITFTGALRLCTEASERFVYSVNLELNTGGHSQSLMTACDRLYEILAKPL